MWESSGLKALLWGAKAPVVASIAMVSQCHRHFYSEALNESSGLLFFVCRWLRATRAIKVSRVTKVTKVTKISRITTMARMSRVIKN